MEKTQKILVIAGTGVLVLAAATAVFGPRIYRDFIAPPAADAPSLSGDSQLLEPPEDGDGTDGGDAAAVPEGDPLDPATLVGVWSVASGSEAGYRVDEVLSGTDVTVTGRTEQVDGQITVGDDGSLLLESATFTVDTASIETDSSNRDDYFRDQAIRSYEHPTATFTLTEPLSLGEVPASGEVVSVEAAGSLTLAGVTQGVTATVEVTSNGVSAAIAGTVPIVFADFGVEAPSLGFVEVEPEGFVEFQLMLARG